MTELGVLLGVSGGLFFVGCLVIGWCCNVVDSRLCMFLSMKVFGWKVRMWLRKIYSSLLRGSSIVWCWFVVLKDW